MHGFHTRQGEKKCLTGVGIESATDLLLGSPMLDQLSYEVVRGGIKTVACEVGSVSPKTLLVIIGIVRVR